jgi:cation diffusion facilitator family transporter
LKGFRDGLRRAAGVLHFGHSHEHDSHEHSGGGDEALETNDGIRALKISLAVLLATALVQAGIVAVSGSVALLADTIHNFSDALTALPLWLAFALSRRATNRRYTYGYGRAEDLAGLFIVATISLSAIVAGYQSVIKLIQGSEISNVGLVAAAAVVGFAGNELVARFRISVGRRIGSAALVADGQHARTDGLTSLAVLGGAVGVWLGYPVLDPLVGLGITVAILFIVKDSALTIWSRMMDAVEPEVVDGIEKAVAGVEGVERVESVRARWIGHRLHSEVSLRVNGGASVTEASRIKSNSFTAARAATPKLSHLTVETLPE